MKHDELKVFRGNISRYPTPTVRQYEDLDLLTICIPWGMNGEVNSVLERTAEAFEKFRTDLELTSPVPLDRAYSSEENRIRNTLHQVNIEILERYNQRELDWGCELLIIFESRHQIVLGRVGHINVFHLYSENTIQPVLGSSSFNRWNPTGELAPLPRNVLGMESSVLTDVSTISKIPTSQLLVSQSPWYSKETIGLGGLDENKIWKLNTQDEHKPYWQVSINF